MGNLVIDALNELRAYDKKTGWKHNQKESSIKYDIDDCIVAIDSIIQRNNQFLNQ